MNNWTALEDLPRSSASASIQGTSTEQKTSSLEDHYHVLVMIGPEMIGYNGMIIGPKLVKGGRGNGPAHAQSLDAA